MRRLIALVALIVALGVALTHAIDATAHKPHAAPSAVSYAVQPPILPGVHDAGAMRACELGLQPVRVAYGPGAEHVSGWTVGTGSAMLAERLAFHLQAVAYDRCTGRNFERSAARGWHSTTITAWPGK